MYHVYITFIAQAFASQDPTPGNWIQCDCTDNFPYVLQPKGIPFDFVMYEKVCTIIFWLNWKEIEKSFQI